MAVLPILEFPDPRLRTVAKPVTLFDDELKSLVADMRETMYAAEGIGLAASQVDVHRRILVIDVSETTPRRRSMCTDVFWSLMSLKLKIVHALISIQLLK